MATDANRIPAIYKQDGGDTQTIDSGGTLEVLSGGALTLAGTLTNTGATVGKAPVSIAVSGAVTAAQSGTVFTIDAADVVVTLPSTAAGLTYTFVVLTLSASTGFSLSPAAADAIYGAPGVTVADNKDIINTAATDALGDTIQVVGNGTTGWVITNLRGTWAREG